MKRSGIIWRLFPVYLLLGMVSLLAISGVAISAFKREVEKEIYTNLDRKYFLLNQLYPTFLTDKIIDISRVQQLASMLDINIALIKEETEIVFDSEMDSESRIGVNPKTVGVEIDQISGLIHQGIGSWTYKFYKINDQLTLRFAENHIKIEQNIRKIYFQMLLVGLVTILMVLLISFGIVHRISEALNVLRRGVEAIAKGSFKTELQISESGEIGQIGQAINVMTRSLDKQFNTILKERNERNLILSSMSEGVILLDEEGNVLIVNEAALALLSKKMSELKKKKIQDTLKNRYLKSFVIDALNSEEPLEEYIELKKKLKNVQAHSYTLKQKTNKRKSVLIVLTDVTRLKRLETLRKDFVANVSHELKTPITLIKGFVETLLDGAIDSNQDARRFLTIIDQHTERLKRIIDDLLTLTYLEQEASRSKDVDFMKTEVLKLFERVIKLIKDQHPLVEIKLECDPNIFVKVNADLIEQALENLLSNAIKYSESKEPIILKAETKSTKVLLKVIDFGKGIHADYQSDVFKRFYRIDKARSRSKGGTGLGLAIVKHIAQIHKGKVTLESELNKGSQFIISLPGHSSKEI